MSNLTQTIFNSFIRFNAFLSSIFKQFTRALKTFFGLVAQIFGFSPSDYFLESDQAQSIKRVEAKPEIESKPDNNVAVSPTNRPKKAKIDTYFLDMAREVKKTSN